MFFLVTEQILENGGEDKLSMSDKLFTALKTALGYCWEIFIPNVIKAGGFLAENPIFLMPIVFAIIAMCVGFIYKFTKPTL